jgi:hypothetical protein
MGHESTAEVWRKCDMPTHAATGAIGAGHQVQIALACEATYLIKEGIAATIQGVGWPHSPSWWPNSTAPSQECSVSPSSASLTGRANTSTSVHRSSAARRMAMHSSCSDDAAA